LSLGFFVKYLLTAYYFDIILEINIFSIKNMEIKTLIIGYKPYVEGEEKRKPAEIRADNYFEDFLKRFNLGELHFSYNNEYKPAIDELNPMFCIVFDDHTAGEIKAYRKDILLYVTHHPTSIFHRKNEVEERKKKQERIFKEVEGLIKMIKEKGESGLSSARTFASMDYGEMYKFLQECIMSDKPDLKKQAWDLLNRNDVHEQFVWMRANIIVDCWQVADAKGKEEFLTIAMKQYIDQGCVRQLNNFTDQDGIEYKQYMFLYPNGADLNYVRRIPIATPGMEKLAYENILEKYETPKGMQMLMEIGESKKLFEQHKKPEKMVEGESKS